VVESVGDSDDGWLLTMTDGRTIDEPQHPADVQLLGPPPQPGYLTLASTVTPGFIDNLQPVPSYPGCWEAWPAQSSSRIAWDMGDSILFSYGGIELPKAPDYTSDSPTQDVDGRQAWTTEGPVQPYTVCVNSSGRIEWLRRTSRLNRERWLFVQSGLEARARDIQGPGAIEQYADSGAIGHTEMLNPDNGRVNVIIQDAYCFLWSTSSLRLDQTAGVRRRRV
jgi:hypothetical protein